MFVSDLRHFLDLPEEVPGPARKMAEHLIDVVRAATAGEAGVAWITALTCRRRPGHRPCPGHIAVFRADLPAPIEWRCTSCGDEGVISGWEDSPFDLRRPRSAQHRAITIEVPLIEQVAATLRSLMLLDTDSERLVFKARASSDGIVLPTDEDDLDELIGFVAAEANHETNRRRHKRLDAAFAVLSDALDTPRQTIDHDHGVAVREFSPAPFPRSSPDERSQYRQLDDRSVEAMAEEVVGKWRVQEMDLWGRDALDLVQPAFIEIDLDGTGRFGFIAIEASMDCRPMSIDGRPGVEFTWEGNDEGDHVSGRGTAVLHDDGSLRGHLYTHFGEDSGFRAVPVDSGASPRPLV